MYILCNLIFGYVYLGLLLISPIPIRMSDKAIILLFYVEVYIMKVKHYKQYCWNDGKVISALKEYKPEDYDNAFSQDAFYDKNNYRPMYIKVLDSNGNPCSSLEGICFDISEDYPTDTNVTQNYVQAVFGELKGWIPATVTVLSGSLFVYIVRFPKDSTIVDLDWESICINRIPDNICFRIDIDGVDGSDSEHYMIHKIPDSSNEQNDSHLIVEEYKSNALKRTCEIGRDEQGTFEIITEAE